MSRSGALVTLAGAALLVAAGARAESSTTLRVELAGSLAAEFVVENLAGTMTVLPGDGPTVTAAATVYAEDASLADAVRFEQVRGEGGVPTLRVVYPLDRGRTIRYPASRDVGASPEVSGRRHDRPWFSFLIDGGDTEVVYDGRRVRLSGSRGVRLGADVEVRVPRQAVRATFRNLVGELRAEGIEGEILLDASHGDVVARALSGTVKADTGSGDVHADGLAGSFTCDTGSGECIVTGFAGRDLTCDTGSGGVHIRQARADRLVADTGSGRIVIEAADVEDFTGDTGSGGIEAELLGDRLRRIRADTGSGDVRLLLPPDATFEATADQGSGELRSRFPGVEKDVRDHRVVGLRRGDARIRIAIDTGSGDARIDPSS